MDYEKLSADQRVHKTYEQTDNGALEVWYDKWAGDYDADLIDVYGYTGPRIMTDMVVRFVPENGCILEAGVGTGLLGPLLSERGYQDLTGIDFSRGMLDVAGKSGAYKELRRMVLGEALDFPSDDFDAAVALGTFTSGHAPASGMIEMTRATRPGGHLIFSLKADAHDQIGFPEVHRTMIDDGRWRLVERSAPVQMMPKAAPDVVHEFWCFEVLS